MKCYLLSVFVMLSLCFSESETRHESLLKVSLQGVNYLIGSQNENGSWGAVKRTKGLTLYAPVPGAHHAFRTACTALAVSGLIAHEGRLPHSQEAINKAEKWLLKHHMRVKRSEQEALYNVWSYAYTLKAFADLAGRKSLSENQRSHYLEAAQWNYQQLLNFELVGGGWGYYNFGSQYGRLYTNKPTGYNNSFTTATVLSAISYAQKRLPLSVNEKRTKISIRSLLRQRLPDGSYLYGEYLKSLPRLGINRPAGSLARTPAALSALCAWESEQVREGEVEKWVDRFIKREGFLSNAKKRPVPHEAAFQISGYFYYYGHYYVAEVMQYLSPEVRQNYVPKLVEILMKGQEKDGSWWDFPMFDYHKAYGTGYVLSALSKYFSY